MKVKDVLNEIEQLNKEAETLDNISSKMWTDENVADYMKKTFNVEHMGIAIIKHRLKDQAKDLEKKLNECEVDVLDQY